MIGLLACGERNLDDELRRFVEATLGATEARDTGYFRDIVAESYVDSRGNDRDHIIDLVRGFFLVNAQIEAAATIVDVVWDGAESARLVLDARIDGNMSTVTQRLEIELLRDGSAWTVIGARWQDGSGRPRR